MRGYFPCLTRMRMGKSGFNWSKYETYLGNLVYYIIVWTKGNVADKSTVLIELQYLKWDVDNPSVF